VIYEEATATTSGSGSGTTNNGIGGSGKRYSIVDNPGLEFTLPTCSPSAQIGPFSYGVAIATVGYRASAQPLQVILDGGIGDQANKRYLIGQQVTASLNNGGLTPTSYSWSASGGSPFKNWTATRDSTTPTTQPSLGTETGSSYQFYFKNPDSATVTCTARLAVPAGVLPATGYLDVTVTRNCTVVRPDEASFSAYTPQNASQYPGPGSIVDTSYPYPANGVGLYYAPTPSQMAFRGLLPPPNYTGSMGIRWECYVRTSNASTNPWGGDGGWNFVQKTLGNRYRVNSGVRQSNGENGLDLLDTFYPYAPRPYYPDPGPDGRELTPRTAA
jgi:hypothetical protein